MEKKLQIIIKVLIAFVIATSLTYYFKVSIYKELVKEDGIFEYLTAILLLITSVLLFIKVIKLKNQKKVVWIVFNLFMVLGLFFGFGEEISWGQRIFSVDSGEFFKSNNLQGETNIHNLKLNGVKFNKWIFSYGLSLVFGLYFLVLPFVYKSQDWIKNLIDKFGIPVPRVKQSIMFLVGSILIFTIPSAKKWEIWECLFGLSFLMIILDPFNTEESVV